MRRISLAHKYYDHLNPRRYVYNNNGTSILLEEQDDYNRSLKVVDITHNNNNKPSYITTKYLHYPNGNNDRYVLPLPLNSPIPHFNVGETIPFGMVSDGLIFDNLNDAFEYANKKHEFNKQKEFEKYQKEQEELYIQRQKHNTNNESFNYFVIYPIIFFLICLYIVFYCIPYIIICLIMQLVLYGPKTTYYLFTCEMKSIYTVLYKYFFDKKKTKIKSEQNNYSEEDTCEHF